MNWCSRWGTARESNSPLTIVKMGFNVFSHIRKLIARLRQSYVLSKYSPTTIAEYLRREGAQIGENCFIVPTSLGTEPYLVKIGNHVAVAHGVVFSTHDGAAWVFRNEVSDTQIFGPIVIEDNCLIGNNAILLPNIRIGRNSIVGAGSVVISDVPRPVGGLPCRD